MHGPVIRDRCAAKQPVIGHDIRLAWRSSHNAEVGDVIARCRTGRADQETMGQPANRAAPDNVACRVDRVYLR